MAKLIAIKTEKITFPKEENNILRRKATQRNAIDQVVKQHERQSGVDEVLQYGCQLVDSLNRATVYRNLNLADFFVYSFPAPCYLLYVFDSRKV